MQIARIVGGNALSAKLLNLVVLVITAAAAGSVIAYEPPSVSELRDLLARRQAAIALDPPSGKAAIPTEGRDPQSNATMLYALVVGLNELADSSGFKPSELRHIVRGRDAATRALQSYGVTPDLEPVFDALSEAGRSLGAAAPPNHPKHDSVQRISEGLAKVAKGMALDVTDLAVAAGVRPQLMNVIRAHLVAAERSFQAKHYAVAIGQFGGAEKAAAGGITFDIGLFEQNILDALEGQTVGNAYAIVRNGMLHSSGADGDARTGADDQADQSATKEMYIASMTKTISALALLIALDEAGISVDAGISPYLPPDWDQGSNVEDITFRYLLTHRTGLNESGNQTLAELQQAIANGTGGLLAFSNAQYTNTNFSLLRILIPRVALGAEVIDIYTSILPADQVYAELYADYVAANVLIPAGINAPFCAPRQASDVRTLYYLFGAPATDHGLNLGDWGLSCGATGYYLTAVELASLLAHLRYTEDIVSDETKDLMNDGSLGWLNPVVFSAYVQGVFGIYRAHGGDSAASVVQGMSGCMMNFHIVVEAVVLINSRGGNIGGHACTVLRDAFDNAWVTN